MRTRINLKVVMIIIALLATTVYAANPQKGKTTQYMNPGTFTFAKENAVLAPQRTNGQSTCLEAVPIVNAAANDNYGMATRYTDNANIIYYDYFSPVGSIANGFRYAGCQQFNDCMYDYEGSYMIMGREDWTETCDWYNNFTEDCPSMTKCTGEPVDEQDRMVFVVINPVNENTTNHRTELSISSVRGTWDFGGYNFDDAIGTDHLPVALPKLIVSSASCDSFNCTLDVKIPNLAFDPAGENGGLYGDDEMVARNLIAGYKIYAIRAEQPPTTGKAEDWNLNITSGQFISRSISPLTTSTVVVDVTSGSGNLYVSYAPVFNFYNACVTEFCTGIELFNIDQATSGNLVSPYLAPHTDATGNPVEEVAISSFKARPDKNFIYLQWKTKMESNIQGFNLYHYFTLGGWTKINSKPIPAVGPSTYSYNDAAGAKATRFRLEAIGVSGKIVAQNETTAGNPPSGGHRVQ